MADNPLTICPECGGSIRRILFPAGIVFKGSGFYKTDHGSGTVTESHHEKSESKEGNTKTEDGGAEKTSGEKSATPASATNKETQKGTNEKQVTAAAD